MKLVLGSSSPRRKEILGYFDYPFETASPDFDERSIPFSGDGEAYAAALAEGKAKSLQSDYPGAIILGADTIVVKDGKSYPKPESDAEAFQTLCELVGSWHEVITAVSAISGKKVVTQTCTTRVLFRNITGRQIREYHAAVHCADKAGAYAIQGAGSLLVEKIDGCFYNVLGLPVTTTQQVLFEMGIDLWDHLGSL